MMQNLCILFHIKGTLKLFVIFVQLGSKRPHKRILREN